jgi:hypothetical protein
VGLNLRQDDENLVFWFRTPLTVKLTSLAWNIPNVFAVNQARDILFSYDGSDLALFLDGREQRHAGWARALGLRNSFAE